MFTYILSSKIKRIEAVYKKAQQHLVIIICNNMMGTSIKCLGFSIFMYYPFQERKVRWLYQFIHDFSGSVYINKTMEFDCIKYLAIIIICIVLCITSSYLIFQEF